MSPCLRPAASPRLWPVSNRNWTSLRKRAPRRFCRACRKRPRPPGSRHGDKRSRLTSRPTRMTARGEVVRDQVFGLGPAQHRRDKPAFGWPRRCTGGDLVPGAAEIVLVEGGGRQIEVACRPLLTTCSELASDLIPCRPSAAMHLVPVDQSAEAQRRLARMRLRRWWWRAAFDALGELGCGLPGIGQAHGREIAELGSA